MTRSDPQAIERYLEDVEPAKRSLIEHYYARLVAQVPETQIGTSYAMAGHLHRGKGLMSVMATRAGLSIVPFSGQVSRALRDAHPDAGLDLSEKAGTIRITVDAPLSDELFEELVSLRVAEIEAKA
ncbi:MAG: iron chaperone [Nocardioides sp.]